jgi:hypothetical protein
VIDGTANADATNAVSLELNKVISDDWVKSSPSLDVAKYFRYFSTTIKAVGCVQEKLVCMVLNLVSAHCQRYSSAWCCC